MKPLSLKIQQIQESQTLALTALATRMKASGIDVVGLTAGEPDFDTPIAAKNAGIKAIEENFTHYTANQGIAPLINAIIQKFEKDNNIKAEPSQILVSCGAKHSIYNALQAICNPGDEVIFQSPYWVTYPEMCKMVDAKPVIIDASDKNNFKITPEQFRAAITPKTKAFIFNSPSNPTGTVYSQAEIEEFATIVAETGIYVISDEIYEKVLYDGAKHFSMGSIAAVKDLVITVNGVSKAYAMTGWRIGFLTAHKSITESAAKVQSQMTSNPTSISQKAAVAALQAPTGELEKMVEEFKRRRDYMIEECSKVPGLRVSKPEGAFYLFPSTEGVVGKKYDGNIINDDIDLSKYLLEKQSLAVVPGSPFGAKNHLRLSYANSMKDLEKAVSRLKKGIEELQ